MYNKLIVSLFSLFLASNVAAESLSTTLEAKAKVSERGTPSETRAVMEAAAETLKASSILENAPQVGSILPDGKFISATGKSTTLYEEANGKPVVVTFYRGGWCPYCNIQLNAYQKYLSEIESLGARLVAISPELPTSILNTSEKNALTFSVLSDTGNEYAKKIGIVFSLPADLRAVYKKFGLDLPSNQGNDRWELPLAATFVLDSQHIIQYAFLDTDYRKRAEPTRLIEVLKGLP